MEKRLVELDALRGLAALSVVLFHFTTQFERLNGHRGSLPFYVPWGSYGVHLFFGISGFVIFMTLRRIERPLDFLVSRFSRLFPAYWAAILLTSVIVVLGGELTLQQPLLVILANFTMLQELVHIPSVDGVYWTLQVELAFYAIMFSAFLLRILDRIEFLLGWVFLKWLWWLFPNFSYTLGAILVQQYCALFVIGICCYRIFSKETQARKDLCVIVFALLTVAVVDGPKEVLVASAVAAVLLLFSVGRLGLLRWPPLVWIGFISYTLYLLHQNIGWTVIRNLELLGVSASIAVSSALIVSLVLASCVTLLVERPAMRIIRNSYRQWRAVRAVRANAGV
ncbi:MAG: acyltransferase [Gammaproteobacteria bacterium]